MGKEKAAKFALWRDHFKTDEASVSAVVYATEASLPSNAKTLKPLLVLTLYEPGKESEGPVAYGALTLERALLARKKLKTKKTLDVVLVKTRQRTEAYFDAEETVELLTVLIGHFVTHYPLFALEAQRLLSRLKAQSFQTEKQARQRPQAQQRPKSPLEDPLAKKEEQMQKPAAPHEGLKRALLKSLLKNGALFKKLLVAPPGIAVRYEKEGKSALVKDFIPLQQALKEGSSKAFARAWDYPVSLLKRGLEKRSKKLLYEAADFAEALAAALEEAKSLGTEPRAESLWLEGEKYRLRDVCAEGEGALDCLKRLLDVIYALIDAAERNEWPAPPETETPVSLPEDAPMPSPEEIEGPLEFESEAERDAFLRSLGLKKGGEVFGKKEEPSNAHGSGSETKDANGSLPDASDFEANPFDNSEPGN